MPVLAQPHDQLLRLGSIRSRLQLAVCSLQPATLPRIVHDQRGCPFPELCEQSRHRNGCRSRRRPSAVCGRSARPRQVVDTAVTSNADTHRTGLHMSPQEAPARSRRPQQRSVGTTADDGARSIITPTPRPPPPTSTGPTWQGRRADRRHRWPAATRRFPRSPPRRRSRAARNVVTAPLVAAGDAPPPRCGPPGRLSASEIM